MTTEEHKAAIEDAIRLAGGPDRVRFAPIATELVDKLEGEVNADGPLNVYTRRQESGLVDVVMQRIGSPNA
jgi:hypothetical protein